MTVAHRARFVVPIADFRTNDQLKKRAGSRRNFGEITITNAVIERLSGASDARIADISASLIRHLHACLSGGQAAPLKSGKRGSRF